MADKKESNPQMLVIRSALSDLEKLDDYVNKVLVTVPIPVIPVLIEGEKNDESEDEILEKYLQECRTLIAKLRTRHQALIQVLRRGNYFRNMNNELLSIFYEIPSMAEESLQDGDIEQALELSSIWEIHALEILKECYPNSQETMYKLLESVARMKIIPMPGGSFVNRQTGKFEDKISYENVV